MPTEKPLKIFVDTNILVALKDRNDPTHKKALDILNKLEKKNVQLFISSDILGETLTVIARKLGKKASLDFYKEYIQSGIKEIFITEDLHNMARRLFKKTSSKKISFIDCSSVTAMKSKSISIAFTFDLHFQKMGIKLIEELV